MFYIAKEPNSLDESPRWVEIVLRGVGFAFYPIVILMARFTDPDADAIARARDLLTTIYVFCGFMLIVLASLVYVRSQPVYTKPPLTPFWIEHF